jgi:hypothetical protein
MRHHVIQAIFMAGVLLFASVSYGADNPSKSNSPSAKSQPPDRTLLENLPPDPVNDPVTTAGSKVMALPIAPSNSIQLDEATKAAYLKALSAYYDYQWNGIEHRKSVYAWQLLSSKVIFFTVIALVLSGVYFSGVQFHNSLHAGRAPAVLQKNGSKAGSQKPKSKTDAIEMTKDLAKRVEEKAKNADVRPADDIEESSEVLDPLATAPEKADHMVTQIEASFQGLRVSSPILGVIILVISFLFFYLYLKYVYPITETF